MTEIGHGFEAGSGHLLAFDPLSRSLGKGHRAGPPFPDHSQIIDSGRLVEFFRVFESPGRTLAQPLLSQNAESGLRKRRGSRGTNSSPPAFSNDFHPAAGRDSFLLLPPPSNPRRVGAFSFFGFRRVQKLVPERVGVPGARSSGSTTIGPKMTPRHSAERDFGAQPAGATLRGLAEGTPTRPRERV